MKSIGVTLQRTYLQKETLCQPRPQSNFLKKTPDTA